MYQHLKFLIKTQEVKLANNNSSVPVSQISFHTDDGNAASSSSSSAAPLKGSVLYKQSKLERETGRRGVVALTHEEMSARHPVLKNAPVEGSYAKGMQVSHKPFNEVVR